MVFLIKTTTKKKRLAAGVIFKEKKELISFYVDGFNIFTMKMMDL